MVKLIVAFILFAILTEKNTATAVRKSDEIEDQIGKQEEEKGKGLVELKGVLRRRDGNAERTGLRVKFDETSICETAAEMCRIRALIAAQEAEREERREGPFGIWWLQSAAEEQDEIQPEVDDNPPPVIQASVPSSDLVRLKQMHVVSSNKRRTGGGPGQLEADLEGEIEAPENLPLSSRPTGLDDEDRAWVANDLDRAVGRAEKRRLLVLCFGNQGQPKKRPRKEWPCESAPHLWMRINEEQCLHWKTLDESIEQYLGTWRKTRDRVGRKNAQRCIVYKPVFRHGTKEVVVGMVEALKLVERAHKRLFAEKGFVYSRLEVAEPERWREQLDAWSRSENPCS